MSVIVLEAFGRRSDARSRSVTDTASRDDDEEDGEKPAAATVTHSPLIMGQTLFELSLRPGQEAQERLIDIATVYRFHAPEPRPRFHDLVWRFCMTAALVPPYGGLEETDFRWAARTLAQLLFDHHASTLGEEGQADLSLVVHRRR